MKNLFNKLKSKLIPEQIDIPKPDKWPSFHNIDEWMEQKVEYYSKKHPDSLDKLFNPSWGDYIPLLVHVGTSSERFKEHIEHYRELKSRYPEAVEKAKKDFQYHSYYREGDPQDYPKDL